MVGGGLRIRHPDAKKPVVTGELWAGEYLLKLLSPKEDNTKTWHSTLSTDLQLECSQEPR